MKNSQQDLIDFVNDRDNIRKAVEGSMEKRNAVMNAAPNQTPQSTFDRSLEYNLIWLVTSHIGKPPIIENVNLKTLAEAKAAITSLVLEEVNKAELSDYATFKWLLKDALQPSSDTRKMSRIYLVQELVDKDYDSLAAQQRSIITKDSK